VVEQFRPSHHDRSSFLEPAGRRGSVISPRSKGGREPPPGDPGSPLGLHPTTAASLARLPKGEWSRCRT
jgi:hypothetical protein